MTPSIQPPEAAAEESGSLGRGAGRPPTWYRRIVTYRDDREALRARVEQLEGELDEARAEIARLRGEEPVERASGWLGAPTRIEHERVIEGELPEAAREEVVELLRAELGQLGRTETLGRTLAWRSEPDPQRGGRRIDVLVTTRGGRTRIHVREHLGALAGGLFGGVVGGAGGGVGVSLLVTGALLGLPFMAAGGLAFAGLTYGVVRTAFSSVVRYRERELARLTSNLDELVRDAVRTPVRARVEVGEAEEEDDEESAADTREERAKR